MKKIILLELCLLFLATAFRGDGPPPGWYLQSIPVNKNITDIYFTDTLNGWAVIGNVSHADTGYILKTTNGGTNWLINYSNKIIDFAAIQFVSHQTGYAASGQYIMKTTNAGNNWFFIYTGAYVFTDVFFLNNDTGWACDYGMTPFGVGLLKTTNGGLNWVQQMDNTYQPKKLFFLNRDTGWVMSYNGKIFRTNNSGSNWTMTYDFGSVSLYNIFFTSSDTGYIVKSGALFKTINGGYNWQDQSIPSNYYPQNIYMINSDYGYLSTGLQNILKTLNGYQWGKQNTPSGGYEELFFVDSLKGWANHGNMGINDIAATVDGGGPVIGIRQISGEAPDEFRLEQNYPNPFNSISKIKYQISKISDIKIVIFDISGREISVLVNQKQSPGTYEYNFDAGCLSSGVYFYALFAGGKRIDTKKMILIK